MKPAAVVLAAVLATGKASAACRDDLVTVSGDWGQANFSVEVADDAQERARGLMFVESLPTLSGMLFVYERPQSVSFWMKNTLIPLDMLFVSPAGEILALHENAVPQDTTPIPGGDGVQMVLEINGGMSARLGIGVGDALQHPAFGPDAILPCSEKTSG